MPVGWFFSPYARDQRTGVRGVRRYCVMDDFTAAITGDGGDWREAECLGDMAVVKVRASAATLATIAADPRIRRVPVAALGDTLDTLTLAQRQQLRTFLGNLGYTGAELQAAFGAGTDLGGVTLGDVLRFALRRRLRPRYDQPTDSIVLDGPVQVTKSADQLDGEVV